MIARQPDMTVVGNAPDSRHALECLAALSPDVTTKSRSRASRGITSVILDTSAASGESPVEFITRVAPCPVIILAREIEHDELLTLLRANAKGYLPFDATPAELVAAIRTAHQGELALHATAARVLVQSPEQAALPAHGSRERATESLTERERQVLMLLCEGCSNKQIAQKLYLSVRTVEGRLNSIYAKLGVHSRAELIVAAAHWGWLTRRASSP